MHFVNGIIAAIIIFVVVGPITDGVLDVSDNMVMVIAFGSSLAAFLFVFFKKIVFFTKTPADAIATASVSMRDAKNTIEEKLEEDLLLPFYATAEDEIGSDSVDRNLWAKALINAKGDENLRKVEYIKLRANALRREN